MDNIDCEIRNILLEDRCSREFSEYNSFFDIFGSKPTYSLEYAGWRFIKAWQERENGAMPDLVVLLRQFVRWMPHSKLPGITSLPDGMDRYIESAGLKLNSSNEHNCIFRRNFCRIFACSLECSIYFSYLCWNYFT